MSDPHDSESDPNADVLQPLLRHSSPAFRAVRLWILGWLTLASLIPIGRLAPQVLFPAAAMAWSLASLFFFFALVLTIAATVRTLFHPEESKQYPLAAISLFAATATVAAWCYGKMHQ